MKRYILLGGVLLVYLIVLAAALVYLKFPYTAAAKHIVAQVNAKAPAGLHLHLDAADQAGFPPGVRLDGLTLRAGGEPIVFERLTAHPALLDLARGRLDATVQGAVLDGTFSLRLRSKTLDNPERIDVELGIDSLDAGQAPKLADIFQGEVAGRVSGEADLSVSTRNLPASSGVVSLQVVNGSAPVSSRYFRPNRLVDAMVEAQARLEQGVVMLEQGVFAAEGLRGGVTGELKLAEKMGNSLADLRGTWTIDPTLVDLEAIPLEGVVQRIRQRKELDLTITGRLEKLTIKPF